MNSYQVARKAGVSRAVVSYVYHGKADQHGITRETQERVRAAIRETGYTPNLFIRDLFLKRRELVAVGGTAAPETVSAVVTPALTAAGYQVQVTNLAAEPAAAFAQVTGIIRSGAVVLIGPAAEGSTAEGGRGEEVVPTPGPSPAPVPVPAPAPAPNT